MSLEWIAIYKDSSVLTQFNEDGTENLYLDINRNKLSEFRLHRPDGELVFSLKLDPDQRLVFRRRNFLTEAGDKVTWNILGWQQTINGKNIQSINYINDEGLPIIAAGKFNEDHPLYRSIELIEVELDGNSN